MCPDNKQYYWSTKMLIEEFGSFPKYKNKKPPLASGETVFVAYYKARYKQYFIVHSLFVVFGHWLNRKPIF